MAIDPNWVLENPEEAARQIELLTIAGNLNRSLVEVHILQRQEMQKRVEELECQVEEASRYLRNTAIRDANKRAEALEEAANETVPAMHQMANWLLARAAEERRKGQGRLS